MGLIIIAMIFTSTLLFVYLLIYGFKESKILEPSWWYFEVLKGTDNMLVVKLALSGKGLRDVVFLRDGQAREFDRWSYLENGKRLHIQELLNKDFEPIHGYGWEETYTMSPSCQKLYNMLEKEFWRLKEKSVF